MRRFESRRQAQRFLEVHPAMCNISNLSRPLTTARYYRELRQRAFASWAHTVVA
jgi:hypothetical protein